MSHVIDVTCRQPATDLDSALRRLVVDCLDEAAVSFGVHVSSWLADVHELNDAVATVVGLRRQGAGESALYPAREHAAMAMLRVMPVHREARALLDTRLAGPQGEALRLRREQLGAVSRDVIDPWLHRTVIDSVNELIDSRAVPGPFEAHVDA